MSNVATLSANSSRIGTAARADGAQSVQERAPFRWTQRDRTTMPVHVHGTLPSWLRGQLVRTAPAVFESGGWKAAHWFDALGLMYGFSIDEQGVRFTQRALDCQVARQIASGRATTASFATPMKRSLLQRLLSPVPSVTDNANVNVVPWQGAWLAMTESAHQMVVGSDDLAARGYYQYEDDLPERLAMTAHPHFDFARNAMVNVGTTLGRSSALWVLRHDARGRVREVEGKLPCARVPYVHDFGLSERHAVLIAHPLTVNPIKMLFSNRGYIDHFRFQPEQGTTLWKLERATGRFTAYQTESLFCFHTVNTFEDGADVVLDFLAFDDASVVSALATGELARTGLPPLTARFVRARLSPGKQHADLTLLSDARFELPNIPYRAQHGRAYDTVWGAALRGDSESEIVRVDLARDAVARFSDPGVTYGEPIFVPRPGATRADEGVVLTVGSAAHGERSQLTVLDATSLAPLARCEVALSLPLGFHGNFKSD